MVKLSKISTGVPKDFELDKDEAEKKVKKLAKKIGELQYILFAEQKQSLLVILQGMDASGKDGVTRKVFGGINPGGVTIKSFKKPSEEELAHDFLWRVHPHVPEKGMIQIFNRSHYEDILIQRVHNWIDEDRVKHRMNAINCFEETLIHDNQTTILKFFLHISKEKQLKKLQERIDDPTKNWKHNDGDWKEHEQWDKYMDCYEYAINHSTVPWHVIPSDHQWYRDYVAANIVYKTLLSLDMKLPVLEQKPETGKPKS